MLKNSLAKAARMCHNKNFWGQIGMLKGGMTVVSSQWKSSSFEFEKLLSFGWLFEWELRADEKTFFSIFFGLYAWSHPSASSKFLIFF